MANFNISYIYNLKDKFSQKMDNINAKVNQNSRALNKAKASLNGFANSANKLGKSMALKVSAPIIALGAFALKSSAEVETMRVGFEAMLGSVDKASVVVKDLLQFTAKTPFRLEGVSKAGRMLLTAGVSVRDLTNELQFLGDISSASNIQIENMAAIFTKAKNKGKAMTEEILQMAERGIPVIQVLSKQYNKSSAEVLKMAEKSEISFDMIRRALIDMTKEGGFANQAMIRQSRTLAGIFSTSMDAIKISLASVGDAIVKNLEVKETMIKLVILIEKLTEKFIKLTETNPKLIKIAIILAGILATVAPLLITFAMIAKSVAVLLPLFAMIVSPIGLIVAGIVAIGVGAVMLYKKWEPFRNLVDSIWNKIKAIGGFLKGIGGKIGGVFSGGMSNYQAPKVSMSPALQAQNGRFTADINLNATKGTVKSVETKEKKATGFNLGLNMQESY